MQIVWTQIRPDRMQTEFWPWSGYEPFDTVILHAPVKVIKKQLADDNISMKNYPACKESKASGYVGEPVVWLVVCESLYWSGVCCLLAYSHHIVKYWIYENARPPIQLLHCIKSVLCYEEEGPVSYEWDGKSLFFQPIQNFWNPKLLCDGLDFTFDIP